MDTIVDSVPGVLQSLFGATADRLARQTGFVERVRRITPGAFAQALSVFLLREPKASLARLAQEVGVSAAAMSHRLSDPAAAQFLHALLAAVFDQLAATP